MPIGDKDAYTDKQKRKAEHIEEGYVKETACREKRPVRSLGRPSTKRTAAVN